MQTHLIPRGVHEHNARLDPHPAGRAIGCPSGPNPARPSHLLRPAIIAAPTATHVDSMLQAPEKERTDRGEPIRATESETQLGWRIGIPQFLSYSSLRTLERALRYQPMTLLIEGFPIDADLKRDLERGFSTRPHTRGIVVRTTPGSSSRLGSTLRRHLSGTNGHMGTLYPYGYVPTVSPKTASGRR